MCELIVSANAVSTQQYTKVDYGLSKFEDCCMFENLKSGEKSLIVVYGFSGSPTEARFKARFDEDSLMSMQRCIEENM